MKINRDYKTVIAAADLLQEGADVRQVAVHQLIARGEGLLRGRGEAELPQRRAPRRRHVERVGAEERDVAPGAHGGAQLLAALEQRDPPASPAQRGDQGQGHGDLSPHSCQGHLQADGAAAQYSEVHLVQLF